MTQDAFLFLHPQDIVCGDNANYHYQGWSGEMLYYMITGIPAYYIHLPTYSLELNPTEKVFSFLKGKLRNSFSIHDDLLESITQALSEINYGHML